MRYLSICYDFFEFMCSSYWHMSLNAPNCLIIFLTYLIDTLINLNANIYVVKRFDHPHSTTRNLSPVWHEG